MHKLSEEEWKQSVQWVGIVAGCVIRKDSKYLLVQESKPKIRGLWNIPAGYVDKGESFEEAAIREAKEETGYDVQLGDKIDIYQENAQKQVKHAYRAEIVDGELRIDPEEQLDVQWLDFDTIQQLHTDGKIRSEWIFDAISRVQIERKRLK